MYSLILRTARISAELFILLFGAYTIASNLAVVFELPFSVLGFLFAALVIPGIVLFYKYGFFSEWKAEAELENENVRLNRKTESITQIAFLVLIVFMVFVALFAHKHNFDDAHYIRTAVDMVDHPEKPVLLDDALGLFEGAPLFIPVYKTHAVETLCAGISSLTGIPVIYIFHFFLPVLGLFLSVMAHLLVFRVLIPHRAMLATIISFVLIYAVSLRAMGNFTFIRMHQGKGFLLGVILPLIITYGIKSATEHKNRNWIILALSQICAIGMNATALWLAPLVANLAVISGTIATKPNLLIRKALLGVLSSAYVVLFGIYIATSFHMPPFYVSTETDALNLITGSINRVFGNGIAMYLSMFIIFFTWIFAHNRLTKMLCLVFPAFLLLVFFNPLTAGFMAEYAVSEQTYWRTAWIIPLQVFAGIIGISPFLENKRRWLIIPKVAFILGMFVVFLVASPTKSSLFSRNSRVKIKMPALKVTREYYVAEQINRILDEDDVLISPNRISMWISTMHQHPVTLVYRTKFTKGVLFQYFGLLEKGGKNEMDKFIRWSGWYKPTSYEYPSESVLSGRISNMQQETGVETLELLLDYEFKLAMKQYISGNKNEDGISNCFSEGLDHYAVTAVCFPNKLKWKEEIINALQLKNFQMVDTFNGFELWKRQLNNQQ